MSRASASEGGPWEQSVTLTFRLLFWLTGALAAGWLVSNVRVIAPDSQAVVIRLGAVARVQAEGLVLAWPRPIERVVEIPAAARQIQLPLWTFTPGQFAPAVAPPPAGAPFDSRFLLTGDASVVQIDAQIFYHITDPAAYMVAAEHVEPALERLFLASTVAIAAGRGLDSILVARPELAADPTEAAQRDRLRMDLMQAANRRLAELAKQGAGLGVEISRIDPAAAIPAAAKAGFDNVLVETQNAEAAIAGARTRALLVEQEADRRADRIATDAAASAQELIAAAQVHTASMATLAQQDPPARNMHILRLYHDRVALLLRNMASVEVLDHSGGVRTILPAAEGDSR